MTRSTIPPNFFAIPFGLAGLAGTWSAMSCYQRAPAGVAWALGGLAALAWAALVVGYLLHWRVDRGTLRRDLTHPVAAPFLSLVLITPMLLIAQPVRGEASPATRIAVDVLVVAIVALGAWFTGQWIYAPLPVDSLHPGYFLPTVAGGLLASICASTVGQRGLAAAMFGLGLICWLILGSIMLGRLLVRPALPDPLLPTIAIEVAPAALASLAWLRLDGGRLDTVVALLGGYGLLMICAQARLLPAYVRLPFMPSTWAFTFSWAAVATAAIAWLQVGRPAGYPVWQYALLAAITVLIGAVAVRTAIALVTGRLIPAPAVAAEDPARRTPRFRQAAEPSDDPRPPRSPSVR